MAKKTGRPLAQIDAKQVEKMASYGCTNEEIGDVFGVNEGTIRKRFSVVLTKARANMKQRLRQAQYRAALNGDRTMLVWLGKTMLGQKEVSTTEWRDVSKMTDEELAAERKRLGLP